MVAQVIAGGLLTGREENLWTRWQGMLHELPEELQLHEAMQGAVC